MNPHTTGPWHVNPPTSEHPSEARVSALNGFVSIYAAPLTRETQANARLIAVAPDAYDFAVAFVEAMRVLDALEPPDPLALSRRMAEIAPWAAAILAKAEGSQS